MIICVSVLCVCALKNAGQVPFIDSIKSLSKRKLKKKKQIKFTI